MSAALRSVMQDAFVVAKREEHKQPLKVGDKVLFRDSEGTIHRRPFLLRALVARRATIKGTRDGARRESVVRVPQAGIVRAIDAYAQANQIVDARGGCGCTEYNRIAASLVG